MVTSSKKSVLPKQGGRAFTLIELLVVVATVSLLLAILLPALNRARKLVKRLTCRNNLRQIAFAWQRYLEDHDGAFYQDFNANILYGGWAGIDFPNRPRPLNSYLSLPEIPESETGASRVFRCPCDEGRRGVAFYTSVGTSYQTNILLIGQDQLGWLPNTKLRDEINERLTNLNRSRVENPGRLLLIGDHGWSNCWQPGVPRVGDWHGRRCWHNMAFLDGHVDFLHIRKGIYITDEYSILPFEELYGLAHSVQDEEPCE